MARSEVAMKSMNINEAVRDKFALAREIIK